MKGTFWRWWLILREIVVRILSAALHALFRGRSVFARFNYSYSLRTCLTNEIIRNNPPDNRKFRNMHTSCIFDYIRLIIKQIDLASSFRKTILNYVNKFLKFLKRRWLFLLSFLSPLLVMSYKNTLRVYTYINFKQRSLDFPCKIARSWLNLVWNY